MKRVQRAVAKAPSSKLIRVAAVSGLVLISLAVIWLARSQAPSHREQPVESGASTAVAGLPAQTRIPERRAAEVRPSDGIQIAAEPPAPPSLSQEEEAILDRYGRDGLPRAGAEAQNAYVTASQADSAEAERRYQLVLNLIAKLEPPSNFSNPELEERQRAYVAALPAEEAKLAVAGLHGEEHERALEKFKDAFFEDLLNRPGAPK